MVIHHPNRWTTLISWIPMITTIKISTLTAERTIRIPSNFKWWVITRPSGVRSLVRVISMKMVNPMSRILRKRCSFWTRIHRRKGLAETGMGLGVISLLLLTSLLAVISSSIRTRTVTVPRTSLKSRAQNKVLVSTMEAKDKYLIRNIIIKEAHWGKEKTPKSRRAASNFGSLSTSTKIQAREAIHHSSLTACRIPRDSATSRATSCWVTNLKTYLKWQITLWTLINWIHNNNKYSSNSTFRIYRIINCNNSKIKYYKASTWAFKIQVRSKGLCSFLSRLINHSSPMPTIWSMPSCSSNSCREVANTLVQLSSIIRLEIRVGSPIFSIHFTQSIRIRQRLRYQELEATRPILASSLAHPITKASCPKTKLCSNSSANTTANSASSAWNLNNLWSTEPMTSRPSTPSYMVKKWSTINNSSN